MTDADVLVVGGGIAGASLGFFLAPRRRVLLVERENGYGYHTSGRSAAEWTACHFDGVMRAVVQYGRPFLDAPPAGFAAQRLLERRGNLMFVTPGDEAIAERFVAHAEGTSPGLVRLAADAVRHRAPYLRPYVVAQAYWDPENCEIDVDALHQGFLRGMRAAGGETRRATEFVAAEPVAGGWRVRLGSETVHARVIVNAAGAWGDAVAAACGVAPLGLQPRRRTAFTFDPGFDATGGAVVDEMASGFYVKASGPLLMVSPGDQTPSAPCDAQPDEYDLAVAVDRLERLTTLSVTRMKARWAGLRTFVADEYPVAGYDAHTPGFFWLVGQGGGGIMSASGLGDLAARLVVGEALPEAATALGINAAALSPSRLVRSPDPV